MADVSYSPENLVRLTIATWVFHLYRNGVAPEHPELAAACEAVDSATDAETGDAAGWKLVDTMTALLGGGFPEPAAVLAAAKAAYGERLSDAMGQGSREERTTRIRRYQFGRRLPWLARIWERAEDGAVTPSWLVVEQMTDEVTAMDPNPWNDIDEERTMPVGDFHVLWELDACTSLHVE